MTLVVLDVMSTIVVLQVAGFDVLGTAAMLPALVVTVALLAAVGGTRRTSRGVGQRLAEVGRFALVSSATLLLALAVGTGDPTARRIPLALALAALPLAWTLSRAALCRIAPSRPERTLVVGSGAMAMRVVALARRRADTNDAVHVVGLVDDDPLPLCDGAPPVLGGLDAIRDLCRDHEITRLIVTFTRARDTELLAAVRACGCVDGLRVQVVPRFFDLLGPESAGLSGLSLVDVSRRRPSGLEQAAKRTLDVVLSAVTLTVLLPVWLTVGVLVKATSRGPIIYRQERVGRGGRPFLICKFRTMTVGSDRVASGAVDALSNGDMQIADAVRSLKTGDDQRVTRIGSFLRRASIDELPQLWNVLRGDMSLVGPRPLRQFEVAALEPWQAQRQDVLPGMTGLWQVLGRSDLDWDERLQLDFSYAHRSTFGTDLRILAETVPAVLRGRGAV